MSDADIFRRLRDLEKRAARLEALESGAVTGLWSPLLTGSGGGGSYTASVAEGEYTLANGICVVWGRYLVDALSSAPAGSLRLTGLPFAARSTSSVFYALAIGYTDSSLQTVMRAIIPTGQSYVDLYLAAGPSAAASLMVAGSHIVVAGGYPI